MIRVEGRVGGDVVGRVTDWTALTWAEEVNTVTGGTITVPNRSAAIDLAALAPATADPVGFIITDTTTGHHVPVHIVEHVAGSDDEVTIPFLVDTALLNEVPAFPVPADPDSLGPPSHWVRTGDAVGETAQFVLVHGGQFSHVDYRRFDLVTATADAGVDVTFRARMQPSLDVIRDTVAGLAIMTPLIENGQMVLFVRGRKTRPEVVFSPDLHTVDAWALRNRAPDSNRFLAGGGGEGDARELARADIDTEFWPRVRARFIDRRQSTGTDLQKAADDAAVWDGPSLTIRGVDSPGVRYGADYLLGDLVTVEVGGAVYTLPVTSVDTEADPDDGTPIRTINLGASLTSARPDLAVARGILRTFGLQENP